MGNSERIDDGPRTRKPTLNMTMLTRNCKRLVKLELSGFHGSYVGIVAIGQCCFMPEELMLSNHGLDLD